MIEGVWYFWRVSDLLHDRDEIVATLAGLVETRIRDRGRDAQPA